MSLTGVTTITAAEYHDDPCDTPSLSASIAHILCTASPLHAWAAHPKLNPDFKRVEQDKFDIGNAAHQILLEGESAVEIIDAPDWRTKDARERRDTARADGKVPLLAHVALDVSVMVERVRDQLKAHQALPALFTEGQPEQTIMWEDGGVMCRARLDWLRDDHQAIDDLKTTSRSASPDAYSRALFGVGGDVQAAFYVRAVEATTGFRPEFRWVVVETAPPFALSVISPGPDVLAIGAKKVDYALGVWRRCLERDEWPAYPTEVCFAELPPYEEARWLERELREAA